MKDFLEGLGKWVINIAILMVGMSIDNSMGNFQSGLPIFTIAAMVIAGYIVIKHHQSKGSLWWLFLLIGIKLLSRL